MTHEQMIELEKKASPAPWACRIDYGEAGVEPGVCNCGGVDAGAGEDAVFIAALRNAAPAYFEVVKAARLVIEHWDEYAIPEVDALRSALANVKLEDK